MGKTTISSKNIGTPAPRWYRITKKIIYTLTGSSILGGTLLRFGFTSDDGLLVMGWLMVIGESLDSLLANGQAYISKDELSRLNIGGSNPPKDKDEK